MGRRRAGRSAAHAPIPSPAGASLRAPWGHFSAQPTHLPPPVSSAHRRCRLSSNTRCGARRALRLSCADNGDRAARFPLSELRCVLCRRIICGRGWPARRPSTVARRCAGERSAAPGIEAATQCRASMPGALNAGTTRADARGALFAGGGNAGSFRYGVKRPSACVAARHCRPAIMRRAILPAPTAPVSGDAGDGAGQMARLSCSGTGGGVFRRSGVRLA